MAPRCPPSDHIPRQICQPHELLRAQLTHPEPPDVDGDVPSFPARSACTGVLIVSINLTGGRGSPPFGGKMVVWSTPMRRVIVDDVDRGFIRDRSGRERRRPVLPTGPVHSGPASPVTATCPPSASRQSRPRRRPAIARRQPGDCDRIPGPRCRPRPPLRTRRNSRPEPSASASGVKSSSKYQCPK